jgi:hypothetical protein
MMMIILLLSYDREHINRNAMKKSQLMKFRPTMKFIESYLHDVAKKADFRNILHNKLSVEVI